MSYYTSYYGKFSFNKRLTDEQKNYIEQFSYSRRMKRDPKILMDTYKGKYGLPLTYKLTNEQRELCIKLKETGLLVKVKPINPVDNRTAEEIYGIEGEFFANRNSEHDRSVLDSNNPPKTQPDLYCDWIIKSEEDGDYLKTGGAESFYCPTEWLNYFVENFFKPWGLVINGEVEWDGEETGDIGKIVAENNEITEKRPKISYD